MIIIENNFFISFQLLLFVITVHGVNYNNVEKIDMFSVSNVNLSNIANEILDQDWTENLECLNELRKIQNGLKTSEKWSMKSGLIFYCVISWNRNFFVVCPPLVVDAWGKFPPGILIGNSFEPGSFSECFRIDRNGANYETQYCIGTLMLEPKKEMKVNKVWKR